MKRGEAGYTLLEMMVALVVFGLVMAGIAQSFRFGLAAWSMGARNAVPAQDMAATDMALRNMIAQALPGSMTGRPGGLSFTTRLPQGVVKGLSDVAIQIAPGGGLVLSYAKHPSGVPLAPTSPPAIEPLAGDIAGFTVTYLSPQNNGPPVWASNWSGAGLPLLVRLHFRFDDSADWPDLVTAPVRTGS